MANENDTGFFRFDTNLDQVVSDIEGGMQRINRALAGGVKFDQGTLKRDTAAVGGTFDALEKDLVASQRRIKDLVSKVGSGAINKDEFARQFQAEVRGAVGGIPQIMAESLALAPGTTAKRIDAASIARGVGQDYVTELVRTFRQLRPQVGDALKGFRLDPRTFNTDLTQLSKNPVAYGQESPDNRLAQLINRVRAEELLAQTIKKGGLERSVVERTGFAPLFDQLRGEAELAGRYEPHDLEGKGGFFAPSSARAELAEEVAAMKRLGAETARTKEQVRLLAEAEKLLSSENIVKVGSRYVDEQGNVFNPRGKGREYVDDEKARSEAQRIRTEMANYQRIVEQDALGQVTKLGTSGSYVVGRGDRSEREVYRVSGESAKRVTAELAVKEALDAQDAALGRQLVKSQRLREFDGKRVLRDESNSSGFVGGFLNRFHRGEQTVLTGLGGQLASATAFSAAYGALFGLQHALSDTVKEFQDYQDSITDLEVATRSSDVVTNSFVHSLGELARVSGANVGAALDTAARGIRAFGAGAQGSELQAIGEATNQAATKLSLIANKALPDATGDLIASGSAFGLAPDQLNEVVDAVANAKRNVGGDAAQISQGLALIAGGAQEAGFSLNEAAAVIGLVQARTDQSGQAIATRLTRIFQIISGSTGKGLARELNIDPNQSVKSQIESYAQIYANPQTSEAVKDRISSALGGTANLRELLPLLKENTTLQNAYAEALSNTGQGTAEFQRKSDNLVGVLKKIKGDVSAIQVEFAKTGIAFPLGAAVRAAEPLLHLLDRILQAYNAMPEPLRDSLGVLLDVLAVSKAIAVVQARSAAGSLAGGGGAYATGLVGSRAAKTAIRDVGAEVFAAAAAEAAAVEASTSSRIAAEQRFNSVILAAAAERSAVEGVATGASAVGGFRGKFAKGAPGILGGLGTVGRFATNPYTIGAAALIGGGLILNKVLDGRQQRNSFLGTNAGAQAGLGRVDLAGTAADLKQASEDVNSAAGNVKKAKSNIFSSGTQDDVVAVLEGESKALKRFAADAAAEEAALAKAQSIGVFGNGRIETIGQLAEGIKALNDAGANGITIMRRFAEALSQPSKKAQQIARPDAIADVLALGYNANLGNIVGDQTKIVNPLYDPDSPLPKGGTPPAPRGGIPRVAKFIDLNKNQAVKALQLDGKEIAEFKASLVEEAARRGITAGEPIGDQQINSLIDYASSKLDLSDVPEAAGIIRLKMTQYWRDQLGTAGPSGTDAINQLITDVTGTPATGEGTLGLLNGKGKLNQTQLLSLFNKSEDGTYPGLQALIQGSEASVPKSDDGRILQQVRAQNVRLLGSLVKRGGKDTPQILIELYNNTKHDLAETTIENLERLRQAAQNKPGLSKAQVKSVGVASLQKEIAAARGDTALLIGIMDNADDAVLKLVRAVLQRAADIANAAQAAHLRLEGIYAFLHAPPGKTKEQKNLDDFDDANSQSNHPKKGSAYSSGSDSANYDSSKDPEKSREEMQQELMRYRNALDLLKGDLTDPVEAARDAVRAARRALAAGGTRADRAENRVEVRRARNELEAAKFSQRLSDVQVAEELGRISHSKYIQYLENEHNRLNAIKKRTRQQQDQLNEIDLALKDAKGSLDGQFNLGDINTNGLVYQVRRQMAEARASAASATVGGNRVTSTQTVAISINGADTAKVRRIISDYLNLNNAQTQTLNRRKV